MTPTNPHCKAPISPTQFKAPIAPARHSIATSVAAINTSIAVSGGRLHNSNHNISHGSDLSTVGAVASDCIGAGEMNQTINPAQRLKGLKNSPIPPTYFCPSCNHALDGAYTTARFEGGRVVTVHNRCKQEVTENPAYTAYNASRADDYSDLLED